MRSITLSVANRTSYKVTWHHVNQRIQKKPIYELSSILEVSFDQSKRVEIAAPTIEAVDLVLICEGG